MFCLERHFILFCFACCLNKVSRSEILKMVESSHSCIIIRVFIDLHLYPMSKWLNDLNVINPSSTVRVSITDPGMTLKHIDRTV